MSQYSDPTFYLIFITIWICFCFVASTLADRYGRSGGIYFFIAAFLSPVLAIATLLAKGKDRYGVERNLVEIEQSKKICKKCYEMVDVRATKCRYCHSLFLEENPQNSNKN